MTILTAFPKENILLHWKQQEGEIVYGWEMGRRANRWCFESFRTLYWLKGCFYGFISDWIHRSYSTHSLLENFTKKKNWFYVETGNYYCILYKNLFWSFSFLFSFVFLSWGKQFQDDRNPVFVLKEYLNNVNIGCGLFQKILLDFLCKICVYVCGHGSIPSFH